MDKYTIKKLLGLEFFKVSAIVSKTEEEIHIKVEPYKRRLAICSGCGKKHRGLHSYDEVIVEDKGIAGLRVYLHVSKRRYVCPEDKRIHTEEIPWLKRWSRVTKRFAKQVNRLTAITTNQEAGWFFGLDDETVYR